MRDSVWIHYVYIYEYWLCFDISNWSRTVHDTLQLYNTERYHIFCPFLLIVFSLFLVGNMPYIYIYTYIYMRPLHLMYTT